MTVDSIAVPIFSNYSETSKLVYMTAPSTTQKKFKGLFEGEHRCAPLQNIYWSWSGIHVKVFATA